MERSISMASYRGYERNESNGVLFPATAGMIHKHNVERREPDTQECIVPDSSQAELISVSGLE